MATLTSEKKMEMWHNGERKQNVKQMSDKKLILSHGICVTNHYFEQVAILEEEMKKRGIGIF